jgi:D-3-phosphoglycerate dehydrogenase
MDRLLHSGCDVVKNPFKRRLTKPELLELLSKGITGLIAGLEPLDREVLKKGALKVISRCGSGISNVDQSAAKDLGITVCNTPDGPTAAVAELTLGAMLSLLRMIPWMDRELHDGNWLKTIGFQLEGKTVAIIGFGRIGQRMATLLAPFSPCLLIVDPFLEQDVEVGRLCSLEEALAKADIVTLHLSGEECILGHNEFRLFKKGAFILNAARGGLIDEDALVSALDDGRIKGAWLDTFQKEPYTGPLAKYPQVVLTPHVGSYTLECRRKMEMDSVENLINSFINQKG